MWTRCGDTHLIQLWPAPKSPAVVVVPDRPPVEEPPEADECVAGSALPSEAREGETEAEFTLTGTGGELRIVPDEDAEYADTVPLPGTGPGPAPGLPHSRQVIVHVRGRDEGSEDGEYYVTVWPEP